MLAISAGFVALEVSSPGRGPLAWIAWAGLVPLLASVRSLAPRAACLCGVLWGGSLAVTHSLLAAQTVPGALVGLAVVGAAVGAFAGVGAALTRRIGFSPLVIALAWIGVELALIPLGWRYGLLAATQEDGSLWHWVAQPLGTLASAFVVAWIAGAFVSIAAWAPAGSFAPEPLVIRDAPALRHRPESLVCPSLGAMLPRRTRAPPPVSDLPFRAAIGARWRRVGSAPCGAWGRAGTERSLDPSPAS